MLEIELLSCSWQRYLKETEITCASVCISYHDASALHNNAVSLHHDSDRKGDVYLVMCEMMIKTSGNFFKRGQ